jgi:olefin beta-lactone synthetase
MNSITPFLEKTKLHPKKMAICDVERGIFSFEDILDLGKKTQKILNQYKIGPEQAVVVAITPGPLLYGVLCGLVAKGVRVVFIEPWMPLEKIQHVIAITKPSAFLSQGLGKLWGLRSEAIRKIPHWISLSQILRASKDQYEIADLAPDHPAYVVFSSGTTGAPKGIIRTHGFMDGIANLFETLEPQDYNSPDLVLFPNVALFHLGTGRGSIIIPKSWSKKSLLKTWQMANCYQPETLSLNPAFLKILVDQGHSDYLLSLKRIIVGGALSDVPMLNKAFSKFSQARFLHLYGGSEAEPVSFIDAKVAVKESQEQGFYQTLCVGEPIPQIDYKFKDNILWVHGPNVAGEYIGDPSQNAGIKEIDPQGRLWHCMNDRIIKRENFFWFQGRGNQLHEDFLKEQAIYTLLQSSHSFLHRSPEGLALIGENVEIHKESIKRKFPEISCYINAQIERDPRHRSRINREKTLAQRRKK